MRHINSENGEVKAWEYLTSSPLSVSGMNEYGRHGWELVAVYPAVGRNQPALLWKRPLPLNEEPR